MKKLLKLIQDIDSTKAEHLNKKEVLNRLFEIKRELNEKTH